MNQQTGVQAEIRHIHGLFGIPIPELKNPAEEQVKEEENDFSDLLEGNDKGDEEFFFDQNYKMPPPFSKIPFPVLKTQKIKGHDAGSNKQYFRLEPITKPKQFSIENEITSIGPFLKRTKEEEDSGSIYGSQHYRSLLLKNFQIVRQIRHKKQLQEVLEHVNQIREIHSAPGLNYFKKYSATELANLNALFNFELIQTSQLSFETYVLVIGDDGGFSDYIFYHFKCQEIYGRAMILKDEKQSYEVVNNEEGAQRLFCNLPVAQKITNDPLSLTLEELAQFVKWEEEKMQENKFAFVMGSNSIKQFQIGESESQHVPYLLVQSIIGLLSLQQEGTLVLKIYETDTHLTNQILFILSLHFRHFTVTTVAANTLQSPERYGVFKQLKQEKSELIGLFIYFFEEYKRIQPSNFFDVSLMSREFLEAMIYLNNGINEKRVSFLQYLEYKSKQRCFSYEKAVNFEKCQECLLAWKLPINRDMYFKFREREDRKLTKAKNTESSNLKNYYENITQLKKRSEQKSDGREEEQNKEKTYQDECKEFLNSAIVAKNPKLLKIFETEEEQKRKKNLGKRKKRGIPKETEDQREGEQGRSNKISISIPPLKEEYKEKRAEEVKTVPVQKKVEEVREVDQTGGNEIGKKKEQKKFKFNAMDASMLAAISKYKTAQQ